MALSAAELEQRIQQAQQGDQQALGSLLELYRAYLGLLVSPQIAQLYQAKFSKSDIVQNTFLQARRAFDDFQGATEAELVAWLRKILVTQLVTQVRHYRTQKRNVTLEQTLQSEVDRSSMVLTRFFVSEEPSPSQLVMNREHAVLLADAMYGLPQDLRQILTWRHLDGLSFQEISERNGMTLYAVKQAWHRALAQLRSGLGDAID